MFRGVSAVLLCFSRLFAGLGRGLKNLGVWGGFLGFYLTPRNGRSGFSAVRKKNSTKSCLQQAKNCGAALKKLR